jgi:predicted DNA-binding protein (MmcQ/YjbR family)
MMNPSTARPERLERLRALCLSLPGASEKVAWGDPTWRVGERIFAMQKGNYSGGRPSVWLKAAPGDQAVLVDLDPQRVFVPPYVGHKGWIGVFLDSPRMDWAMLSRLVAQSHALIAGSRRPPGKRRSQRRPRRPTAASRR